VLAIAGQVKATHIFGDNHERFLVGVWLCESTEGMHAPCLAAAAAAVAAAGYAAAVDDDDDASFQKMMLAHS
jgi:hypothetical protein